MESVHVHDFRGTRRKVKESPGKSKKVKERNVTESQGKEAALPEWIQELPFACIRVRIWMFGNLGVHVYIHAHEHVYIVYNILSGTEAP